MVRKAQSSPVALFSQRPPDFPVPPTPCSLVCPPRTASSFAPLPIVLLFLPRFVSFVVAPSVVPLLTMSRSGLPAVVIDNGTGYVGVRCRVLHCTAGCSAPLQTLFLGIHCTPTLSVRCNNNRHTSHLATSTTIAAMCECR
jgi:hypothetical protein